MVTKATPEKVQFAHCCAGSRVNNPVPCHRTRQDGHDVAFYEREKHRKKHRKPIERDLVLTISFHVFIFMPGRGIGRRAAFACSRETSFKIRPTASDYTVVQFLIPGIHLETISVQNILNDFLF